MALLHSCCSYNKRLSILGQSLSMAWNSYMLHLVFKFLFLGTYMWDFQYSLACCNHSTPCIMHLHVMFWFLIHIEFCIWPISFYDHCFLLPLWSIMNFVISGDRVNRYWRIFLNNQKTENVLTAKASRYPGEKYVTFLSCFMNLKQLILHDKN